MNRNFSGSNEFLQWFEEKGCNWIPTSNNNRTPLQWYLSVRTVYDTKVLEYLLGRCDVNNVDNDGRSALMTFMWRSNQTESHLQLFIDHGADIHFVNKYGDDILDFWFTRDNWMQKGTCYSMLRILL